MPPAVVMPVPVPTTSLAIEQRRRASIRERPGVDAQEHHGTGADEGRVRGTRASRDAAIGHD